MNDDDLTDDQATAVGAAAGLCCCIVGMVGIAVLIYFLVRNSGSKGSSRGAQQQPAVVQTVPGTMHLSVLAMGVDASVREGIAGQLSLPLTSPGPVQARVELVQRFSQVLLAVQPAWRYFGYGEKDLGDLSSAEQSYRMALDDFRQRSGLAGEPDATLAVLTLVLATSGALPGVSALDDPNQIREVLASRSRLDSSMLLGAEMVWAPASGGMSDDTLLQRFPEMHRLTI